MKSIYGLLYNFGGDLGSAVSPMWFIVNGCTCRGLNVKGFHVHLFSVAFSHVNNKSDSIWSTSLHGMWPSSLTACGQQVWRHVVDKSWLHVAIKSDGMWSTSL